MKIRNWFVSSGAFALFVLVVGCKQGETSRGKSQEDPSGFKTNKLAKDAFQVTAFRDPGHGAQWGQSIYLCLDTLSDGSARYSSWRPKAVNVSELESFVDKAAQMRPPVPGSGANMGDELMSTSFINREAEFYRGLRQIVGKIIKKAKDNLPDEQSVYRFDVLDFEDMPGTIENFEILHALKQMARAVQPTGPGDSVGPSTKVAATQPRKPCP